MEEENKPAVKEEIKTDKKTSDNHNKILRNFFIFIGIVILIFAAWIVFSYLQSTFDYRGVQFAKVDEIAPYVTSLPVNYGVTGKAVEETANFNFYFRNDPRELDKIPFDGDVTFLKNIVMNSTGDIMCKGMGVVGTVNLANLYGVLGARVVRDPNVSCDDGGRYTFIQIEAGDETKIKQIGNSCYLLTFKDCEVLQVTERMMTEMLVKLREIVPNP
ncbi:hypothetical protein HYT23_00265 [Candidatus Pacearchaeota archaeon]|nr:hypothetical protein [Candidatus Pacearchaeota archaeon]